MRILLLEDDSLFSRTFCVAVATAGYQVCLTSNFEEAIEQSSRFRPQVAVIDVMISAAPVSSRFLEDLRAIDPAIKIVLITGYPEVVHFVRRSSPGVARYLLKPFRRQQLLELLEQLVDEYNRENYFTEEERKRKG